MPHLNSQAVPKHIFARREASFIKFGTGFGTASLYLFRGTQRLFSLKYLNLKARNFYMTVPVVYNFQSLSNKIPSTLLRCLLGSFLVISFIFLIRFCCTFLFSRFNSQRAIKIYLSKGRILLWPASQFVCDIT